MCGALAVDMPREGRELMKDPVVECSSCPAAAPLGAGIGAPAQCAKPDSGAAYSVLILDGPVSAVPCGTDMCPTARSCCASRPATSTWPVPRPAALPGGGEVLCCLRSQVQQI